ncbi:endonuclease domain-containing protein [Pseudoxanthomonas sp. JBR18]|uniref:endonuclease domain-containing protein n=1 Tax=Pseudoxanthomonas sp. JBR18 TaxID=2969308 RepID=UPI00230583C9|nr:endonuclease domain-containing protein [Pseudoxanthomonas sp. JBR18]WCE04454.1 endonuclease domain-containing protein [Pseudoxanthomonas sp. JBR18]
MTALFRCSRCQVEKPRDAMSKRASRPNGLHGWCKACMNTRKRERKGSPEQRAKWGLKTRYGLTPADVDAMRERQGGVCGICRQPMNRECVDHDHESGKVRGLLCHPCNVKLHSLDRWPHYLAALDYLERTQ